MSIADMHDQTMKISTALPRTGKARSGEGVRAGYLQPLPRTAGWTNRSCGRGTACLGNVENRKEQRWEIIR